MWWENSAVIGVHPVVAVEKLTIEQIVASAGDGTLKDDSLCSQELRNYLAQIPNSRIAVYVDHCLSSAFNKGGMVLQDLVMSSGGGSTTK